MSRLKIPLMDGSKRSLVRPSWIDSLSMLTMAESIPNEISLIGGTSTKFLNNDPTRFGFTIFANDAIPLNLLIGPNENLSLYAISVPRESPSPIFDIFRLGPLISYEWYIMASVNTDVLVYTHNLQDWSDNESPLVES